jgi:hypothetical protein
MKHLKIKLSALAVLVIVAIGVTFTSCKKDVQVVKMNQEQEVQEPENHNQPMAAWPPKVKEVGVKGKWYLYRKSTGCKSVFAICKFKSGGPYIKFKSFGYAYVPPTGGTGGNSTLFVLIDKDHAPAESSMTFESGEDCFPEFDQTTLDEFGINSIEIIPGTYDINTNSDGDHEMEIDVITTI